MSIHSTDHTTGLSPVRVQVGIDAAVVANHHVCVREILPDGQVRLTRFTTPPTLAGLDMFSVRLSNYPGVVAVAEPTSMTWLALSIAMRQAGGDLSLLGARHAARLRGAIIGKDKSDVIDADVLAIAGEVFTLTPAASALPAAAVAAPSGDPPREAGRRRQPCPSPADLVGTVGLSRRVVRVRRVAADRRRGPDPVARPACPEQRTPRHPHRRRRRPHPRGPGRARPGRGDPDRRQGVDGLLGGHLDLDALAWEVGEHLHDMHEAQERIAAATAQATGYWADLYGDDLLLGSVPGMGPATAPTVRAFLGDGSAFTTAKAAASYVGMNPSTWSSGTVVQPSRAITKEGPAVLRLAFYQAAGGARRVDPQLAAYYRHLMVDRGHGHTKATVAVARKLIERTWTVLHRDQPYQLRDTDGTPLTRARAKEIARTHAVPPEVRARARARSAATHRSKLSR